MAELKMETPMKEMAVMTRFTLTGALAAICRECGKRGVTNDLARVSKQLFGA